MAGKFEVYTDKSGQFRFRLKAGNGEVIAASEAYKAKASCLKGIESVKKNAAMPDAKFEDYTDKAGKFRFRLKAGNNEVIATGEAYESKASCLKGIESVKKNAPTAKIEELP